MTPPLGFEASRLAGKRGQAGGSVPNAPRSRKTKRVPIMPKRSVENGLRAIRLEANGGAVSGFHLRLEVNASSKFRGGFTLSTACLTVSQNFCAAGSDPRPI